MRRTTTLLVAAALAVSACSSGSDAPTTVSSGPPAPADQDSTHVEAHDPPPPSVAIERTIPSPAPPVEEAPAPSGAAATFSADHLMVGAGAMFTVLDDPPFVTAAEAIWLSPDDVVLGVVRDGAAVAFPVMQMAYHHIANVNISGEPYLVTY